MKEEKKFYGIRDIVEYYQPKRYLRERCKNCRHFKSVGIFTNKGECHRYNSGYLRFVMNVDGEGFCEYFDEVIKEG